MTVKIYNQKSKEIFNEAEDNFFETLFSINNIENNIIYLNIDFNIIYSFRKYK